MSKEEIKSEMDKSGIPNKQRGIFIMWAKKWGIFSDMYCTGNPKWIQWGPLEVHHKVQRTMSEMWEQYKLKKKTTNE